MVMVEPRGSLAEVFRMTLPLFVFWFFVVLSVFLRLAVCPGGAAGKGTLVRLGSGGGDVGLGPVDCDRGGGHVLFARAALDERA